MNFTPLYNPDLAMAENTMSPIDLLCASLEVWDGDRPRPVPELMGCSGRMRCAVSHSRLPSHAVSAGELWGFSSAEQAQIMGACQESG